MGTSVNVKFKNFPWAAGHIFADSLCLSLGYSSDLTVEVET